MRILLSVALLAIGISSNGCSGSSSAQGTRITEFPDIGAEFFEWLNGDMVIFIGSDDAGGAEPWVSDGTPEGTFALEISPGPASSMANPLVPGGTAAFAVDGGVAYFVADDGINGREIWRTDGMPEGTSLVADLVPGPTGFLQEDIVIHNNKLFVSGRDDVTEDAVLFVLNL